MPDVTVVTRRLGGMRLMPLDGEAFARREALIDRRAFDDPLFAPARDLLRADAVVVAAPYWDLMFPAMLKAYIEHVFIREMTFCYREDECIGLCHASRALYLTTAGSPIGTRDFGAEYLREALAMLGVTGFESVAAEGLDLAGADVDAILAEAARKAAAVAETWGRAPK